MANSRGRGRGSNSRSGHPGRRPDQRSAAKPHANGEAKPDPYGTGLSGLTAKKTGWLLYWLSQRPKWFLPVLLVVMLLLGLILHPWGAIFMFLLGAFLVWMTILSWPSIRTGGKITRIVFIAAIFGYGIYEVVWYLMH
jgi:hypothetical protein